MFVFFRWKWACEEYAGGDRLHLGEAVREPSAGVSKAGIAEPRCGSCVWGIENGGLYQIRIRGESDFVAC